ncbi:MAG: hypothetical protein ACJKTH_02650 [Patescibacteria group bacterium UBA2163]
MVTSTQSIVRFFLPILGVVVLFIVVGWFSITEQDRSQDTPSTSFPALDGLSFLVESDEGDWYSVQQKTSDGFVTQTPEFTGTIIDYARQGEVEALIQSKDGFHQVLYREKEGDWRVVSESPFEKATLKLSEDGTLLGFSERTETEMDSADFEAWQIVVYSLETSESTLISGYAPQFVTVTEGWTLIYFSSSLGLAMYEPISGDIIYSEDITPVSTRLPVKISSDGTTLISYNETTQDFVIFDLQNPTTIGLNALGTLPPYNDIYKKDGLLFGLDIREKESFMWVHALDRLDEGEQIYTFPENIIPLKFSSS